MRTANPALNTKTFKNFSHISDDSQKMTLQGTVNKTFILTALVGASALWSWNRVMQGQELTNIGMWTTLSAIGGLVIALVIVFKKTLAPTLAPAYALIKGVFLGFLSAMMEQFYPGIAFQAVSITFAILFSLLAVYKSGLIAVTENFKLGVAAATGGIFLIYVLSFLFSLFGFNFPLIHESGTIGVLFSLFVIGIASMNLVLDFDFIENGAEQGSPKYMEWYAAFGLMVTLIWLYVEILHLLAKLRDR